MGRAWPGHAGRSPGNQRAVPENVPATGLHRGQARWKGLYRVALVSAAPRTAARRQTKVTGEYRGANFRFAVRRPDERSDIEAGASSHTRSLTSLRFPATAVEYVHFLFLTPAGDRRRILHPAR